MNHPHQLLDVLTRHGVLINVSVRYWRGCKKLAPEDIGLEAWQLSDRLIQLGHKRLLPKDALKDLALVESRAHAYVEQNTFPFLNGLGHFVPNPKLEELATRLKELEAEFWQAKQAFMQSYTQLRANASKEWMAMAQKLSRDPNKLVAAIESSFPALHRMERLFGFDIQLFQVCLPEKLEMELITLADQQQVMQARDKAVEEASAKIHHDAEIFVQECITSLRQQTALLCQEMLASIGSSETGVHQKTLNRLVKFIDQFKAMNFANDTVMEEQLEKARQELLSRTAAEYRDSSQAKNQLIQGLEMLRDKARSLASADHAAMVQRFGELGRRKFDLAV